MGTKLINVGLLTGDGGTGIGGGFEVSAVQLAPQLRLGLGGTVGFYSESVGNVDITRIPLLANANLHLYLPSVPELDLFAGAALGIISVNVENDIGDNSGSDSVFGINLGGRYYFTPTLAATGQIGVGDIPEIFLGISFKF